MATVLTEIILVSFLQLNILFYDRRDLSGQKSCHPAQVLGGKKEVSSPFIIMNGYSISLLKLPQVNFLYNQLIRIYMSWLRTLATAAHLCLDLSQVPYIEMVLCTFIVSSHVEHQLNHLIEFFCFFFEKCYYNHKGTL